MDGSMLQYAPGDPRLVDKIVCQLKSQGIFDRFRKECIADVDTKPAYQNLHQRVEGTVSAFLTNQEWRPELNKNQLRDSLRKHIHESGILDLGVERIVDQVVNPKILPVLLPQIEDVVYSFLGMEKPKTRYSQTVASLQTPKNFKPLKMETLEDLLPKDLDPISPGSVGVNSDDENGIDDMKTEAKDDPVGDDDKICEDEDSSPPFEPIEKITAHDESSLDSHISGISGLTSHDSQMSNLSYGKEIQPPPEPNASHKIPPVDLSNQDSQLSKVSSGSRLSIVFSDEGDKSDQKNSPFTSDMDIQNDDSGLSKNGGVIEFESVAPQPLPANEDSNSVYDSGITKEYPAEVPCSCSSPLEPLPDKLLIEDQEPVQEQQNKIDDERDDYSEVVKESDIEEKYLDREKESEINDERKHCNASSDSRDSRRSESAFHSSDSGQRKEEKERNHKIKDNLKHEEKMDCKEKSVLEDKQDNEYEEVGTNDSERLIKDVEDRDQSKLDNRSEITKDLEIPEDEEKNLKEEDHKERDFSKDKVKCDIKDLKEKVKTEDNEKVKSEKDKDGCKEKSENENKDGLKDKSEKDNKDEIKEKSEKDNKDEIKEKSEKDNKDGIKEKSEKDNKDGIKESEKDNKDAIKEKSEKDNKDVIKEKSEKDKKSYEDKGKENVKDKNKERETEREGSKEKYEKESSKEKSRHDEKNRDSSREKAKVSDKDKQKVDVKIDKDSHKDKPKTDDRSRKDVSKDKARHDRSDKGSSRDTSRHKEQERSRSKNDGKEKKDEKSKEDRNRRNEKESSKEKLKKDVPDATKNEEGEDKRNKSQNDQKRDKDRSKENSRHSDKNKSDKGKGDDKVKEVKSETRDGVSKHESKGSEKPTSKDSRGKIRTESKEKEDRSEKKESRKDERNRDKSKEDRNDKDKPKDDKKDKDKPREDKVDKDRSRSDKDKSKDNKSDREKPKDEKDKDRSSRSSHSSKDGETSKKSDRESSSKSRSSSSTSGASDKSRDSRKKEKEKSRPIPDDHSSHRDRNSDDRRSTDRDSNGAAHGQSAATRNEAHASRRHERSGADDGGSNTSNKSESGGNGGNGGGSESTGTTVAATPMKKESTDARETPSDEGVAPSLPFKKRPVLSSPEPNESAAPDEYDCVNNASGKLVLKLKKPKIAANIFEVRKIMHLRKSIAKNEKKRLDADSAEDQVDESSGDEPELRFFSDEEARPDAAFMKFVNDLEKSETLCELAASDEEEMPEHTKAKRAREEPSTSGDTSTPVLSSLRVDSDTAQEDVATIGRVKTDTSSGMKESPASSEPRGKSGAAVLERREKRRRDVRRDTGKDVRTRNTYRTDQEGPASPETASQTPVSEYLPSHISNVLGIDSGLSVNISKDSGPVSEKESPVKNVIRSSKVAPITRTSPTVPCSPISRGRPPKRRAAGSPAPAVSEVPSVVAPKRLRNDTSSVPDQVPSVVAVDIVKTIETTASRIIYPSTTTSRPSTLGLRRVPTTRSLSPGIINYGGYIPKEIVEVKVLDVDGDDEYSSSIKENNNVDKSSSDDEKGCGDDMSLSKELISTALRDLMLESGLNLGESPAPSAPAPAVTSKDETGAEGATSTTGRRGGVKAVRGRRLGLARPTRRSGSDSLSPQTSGEFMLSPSRNRDNPEAKAVIPTSPLLRSPASSSSCGRRLLPSCGDPARAAAAVALPLPPATLPPPSAALSCCVLPRQQLLQQQYRRRWALPRERVLVQARVRERARSPRWPAAVPPQQEAGANSGSRVPPRAYGWRDFYPPLVPPSPPQRRRIPSPRFPDFSRR